MVKYYRFLYSFIFACVTFPAEVFSQNDFIEKFESYTENHPYEKLYAHLNRTDHITGEILWFKVYCVDGRIHRPFDISRVAYAEILDAENKPVLQTKVALTLGEGSGSFFLPATLPTGHYLFRAYTNWMKNSKPEFFFHRKITIVNTLKENENTPKLPTSSAIDVQFLPEGGNVIEGIPTRIGVKAINSKGMGVDCQGVILNQAQDTIAKFETLQFGIGSFLFTAQANQNYEAVIFGIGFHAKFNFPEIKKSGYGLSVTEAPDDKIKVKVSNPDGVLSVHLLIHTRQSVKVSEVKTTREKSCEFFIDKDKLGGGVSHITIFDQGGSPVCERLYFKKSEKVFNLTSVTDQKEYSVRRKVQLTIQNDQHLSGSLSASVFKGDSLGSQESIIDYLFLTSDLTGPVEHPEFYFSSDPNSALATDNLMLTQGWRRFKWEAVLSEPKSVIQYLPEIKGHLIQGRILDNNNTPIAGKIAYLATPGKKIRLYVSKSDTSGIVRFQMKGFQETGKIIAQANYELDSLSHIEIYSPFSNEFSHWTSPDLMLNNSIEDELINRSVGMQIQDAFYEDETYFRFKRIETDSIPFYGMADEVYMLDDYTRFPVLEEVMREYVKGVWVRKRRDKFRFMVINKPKNEMFKENPLTLLDGVPMFDINKVLEIDPLQIKKLEVMTRKYFLGPLVLDGIVSLSTYNGDLGGIALDSRSVILDYEGLQGQREFYSPRYTSPELRGSRLPDQRHQLYWNPSITLEKSQSQIDFYTSDVEGNFYVVVEGLSNNGLPGFAITSFKVSR